MSVKTFEQKLFDMLESKQNDVYKIEPVVDVANNKLYYQTSPYVEDGKIKITRVAEYDIEIKRAYSIVEENDLTTKFKEKECLTKSETS